MREHRKLQQNLWIAQYQNITTTQLPDRTTSNVTTTQNLVSHYIINITTAQKRSILITWVPKTTAKPLDRIISKSITSTQKPPLILIKLFGSLEILCVAQTFPYLIDMVNISTVPRTV